MHCAACNFSLQNVNELCLWVCKSTGKCSKPGGKICREALLPNCDSPWTISSLLQPETNGGGRVCEPTRRRFTWDDLDGAIRVGGPGLEKLKFMSTKNRWIFKSHDICAKGTSINIKIMSVFYLYVFMSNFHKKSNKSEWLSSLKSF